MNVGIVGFKGSFIQKKEGDEGKLREFWSKDKFAAGCFNSKVELLKEIAKKLPDGDQITLTTKPTVTEEVIATLKQSFFSMLRGEKPKEIKVSKPDVELKLEYKPGKKNPEAEPIELTLNASDLDYMFHDDMDPFLNNLVTQKK